MAVRALYYRTSLLPSRRVLCALNAPARTTFRIQNLRITPSTRYISSQSLPTILQPSFWRSILPKALRSDPTEADGAVPVESIKKRKDWNPATFFIVIFILIGSQAIQMISLQRSFDLFSDQTEAKLAALREVVRRIQNGEDIDVKAMLGTGDEVREREWEEVIRELEEEDARIQSARRRKKARRVTDNTQPVATAENDQASNS